MYVRDARNREEVWLLDHIEAMDLDETAFRSRDYVIAIDEESGTKAGFGRIRIHPTDTEEKVCELTSIGVLDGWRSQGVGAHLVERLVEYASDLGVTDIFMLTTIPEYFSQFGFAVLDDGDVPPALSERLSDKREDHEDPVVPMSVSGDGFDMPNRLRDRFKTASQRSQEANTGEDPETLAEEFGIDPEEATYKYDPRAGRD